MPLPPPPRVAYEKVHNVLIVSPDAARYALIFYDYLCYATPLSRHAAIDAIIILMLMPLR